MVCPPPTIANEPSRSTPDGSALMKVRACLFMFLAVVLSVGALDTATSQESKPSGANDLSMEVAALQTLRDLDLTPAQMAELSNLARQSAPKGQHRESAKTSPEFSKALSALYTALSKGDDKQIGDARE